MVTQRLRCPLGSNNYRAAAALLMFAKYTHVISKIPQQVSYFDYANFKLRENFPEKNPFNMKSAYALNTAIKLR